ncbi:hypothetical protein EV361DRAFT_920058 [Lentinula raphanica]|nr:hypothetical protein F5880DRAFT_1579709 [Lentinula raphanica]KAJ3969590.1 hypothetical protein EV361DRAFT_920058 [Lentinula raphanica]
MRSDLPHFEAQILKKAPKICVQKVNSFEKHCWPVFHTLNVIRFFSYLSRLSQHITMLFRPFRILVVLCPLSLVYAAPTGGIPQVQAGEPMHTSSVNYEVWFGTLTHYSYPQDFDHRRVPSIVHKQIKKQLAQAGRAVYIRYLNDFPENGIQRETFEYTWRNTRTGASETFIGFTNVP